MANYRPAIHTFHLLIEPYGNLNLPAPPADPGSVANPRMTTFSKPVMPASPRLELAVTTLLNFPNARTST
ncbi:hypothetical protein PENANT_c002G11631 [Penicillium antarcticum]|uniref:Uncharacterized protein n=1 Tax=Penicillium antarcticum TaxID=416450 RepID=A0A1V6QKQ2_9EURO|nr:hypothetical protein PENANT_c002G11631 [Penicillium antarcticum]